MGIRKFVGNTWETSLEKIIILLRMLTFTLKAAIHFMDLFERDLKIEIILL